MKFKSRNCSDLVAYLREEKKNFIDEDFPHNDESIAKDEDIKEKVEWKRVEKFVEKPVFANLNDT